MNNNKLTTLDLNSGSTIYRAVFETASGKIKIDNINDQSKENPSQGEITFNIPGESSEEIINSTDRTFYITALAEDGTETLMYTGEWRKPSEQDEVDLAIQQAREDAESFLKTESKITEIENKLKIISNAQLVKKQVLTSKAIIPGFVGKKTSKSISTVNRFGMKTPSKIKTNRGNAGSNNQ